MVTGEAAHLAELTAPAPLVAQLDREVILRLAQAPPIVQTLPPPALHIPDEHTSGRRITGTTTLTHIRFVKCWFRNTFEEIYYAGNDSWSLLPQRI